MESATFGKPVDIDTRRDLDAEATERAKRSLMSMWLFSLPIIIVLICAAATDPQDKAVITVAGLIAIIIGLPSLFKGVAIYVRLIYDNSHLERRGQSWWAASVRGAGPLAATLYYFRHVRPRT